MRLLGLSPPRGWDVCPKRGKNELSAVFFRRGGSGSALLPAAEQSTPGRVASQPAKSLLPFTVRIVRTDQQLERAVQIRSEAYSRHVPTLGEILGTAEPTDRSVDSIVFLAESKRDLEPLGTIRIQTNFTSRLPLEDSITLPEPLLERPMAGVSRLAVKAGSRGRLVKLALFKALHRYCLAKQVEYVLIGARPPLDQTYTELGFEDVFPDALPRPLSTAAGLPHRILCFEVFSAERRWHALSHPLYRFMGSSFHPDIEIFSSVSNMWSRPRARRLEPVGHVSQPRLDIPLV